PMAFEGISSFAGAQLGLAARALVVFHTPPPAAPMNTVQLGAAQLGATAIAVARPEKIVAAVPAVDSLTTVLDAGTPLGPSSCQLAATSGEAMAFAVVSMAVAAVWAAWRSAEPIHCDGSARLSYASCAGPSIRDPSPLEWAWP